MFSSRLQRTILPQFYGNEYGWDVLGLCELSNGKRREDGLMNVKFRKLINTSYEL